MGVGSEDRLDALLRALALDRGLRGKIEPTEALGAGARQLMCRLPAWAHDDQACGVYGLAFEEGFVDALHRFRIVLGLPEVRGREREALELALDPTLTPAEIAVRLRAAATAPAGGEIGNVVPFLRKIDVVRALKAKKPGECGSQI